MVDMVVMKTMRKKTTWNSKHFEALLFLVLGYLSSELFGAYVTQANAHNDFHVYKTIYPDPMTNDHNQNLPI